VHIDNRAAFQRNRGMRPGSPEDRGDGVRDFQLQYRCQDLGRRFGDSCQMYQQEEAKRTVSS
jgi:hypothetical protein